jgi:hypothetical protein
LAVGKDALKVILYVRLDFGQQEGDWMPLASFVSDTLNQKKISSGTWEFQLYVKRYYDGTDTYAYAYWGNTNCLSLITGMEFTSALPQEVALARGAGGDFFGMIMYPYMIVAGDLIYGLAFLFGAGVYYFRYKKFEPVLVIVLLLGEILGFMIPDIAWRLFYFLLLFVFAVVLFRVMH